MVSLYMPDVVVEIAFDSNFATPAASRTWTDVSSYVEFAAGIDISVGRQDERSTADANSLTLTLDNSDGRFTAMRAASPYYPNVKIGRPIRVTATPPGGSASTRFVGFIDEWPVEWDGSDAYARATIRASSRMSRLGLTAKMRSAIETEILSASPYCYWTLGDPSGSTSAAEASDGRFLTLAEDVYAIPYTAPVFGNAVGPSTDGLTAVEFGGGGTSSLRLNTDDLAMSAGARTLRCWMLVTTPPTGGFTAVPMIGGGLQLTITSAGVLQGGGGTVGPNVVDGSGHDVHLVRDGVNEMLYVDGVLVDTVAAGPAAASNAARLGSTVGAVFVLAHAAIYNVALSPAQVSAQAAALLSGFAGDTTDERVLRLLAWSGVAAAEVDAEVGVETMTYQQTSGQSVIDALRECESTEGGVLFDGPDGDVKFHNRSHRYTSTPAATLDMASQHVGSDYSPKVDRSTLINSVRVENPTTGWTADVTDTASTEEYGIATGSATSVADTYAPIYQKAEWLIAAYAEPRTRVPSLTVDVLAHQGLTPSAQTLLAVTVSDLLAVTNAPTQSDTTSPSYYVEGYTESIGPESYSITYNLSPSYPTLNVLVLDSATRGLLDTDILAY